MRTATERAQKDLPEQRLGANNVRLSQAKKKKHIQSLCISGVATRRMAWGRQTGDIKFHLAIKTFKV